MRNWGIVIVWASAALGFAVSHAAAAESSPPGLRPLAQLLGRVDDPAVQADVLRGIDEALKGRRRVTMPEGWPAVYRKLSHSPLAEVREKARASSSGMPRRMPRA